MELDIPVVLALNMMDEVRNSGSAIDVNKMERLLSVPVVPIAAAKNEGVEELINHAIHIAKYNERPERTDFCLKDENGGAAFPAAENDSRALRRLFGMADGC